MLDVAQYHQLSNPAEFAEAIVTAKIDFPDMSASEVCVFFDREHFDWFYSRDDDWQTLDVIEGQSLAELLKIRVPAGFTEHGYRFVSRSESGHEEEDYETEWWCYVDGR